MKKAKETGLFEKARQLIHCMLVESVSEYNNDIVNF